MKPPESAQSAALSDAHAAVERQALKNARVAAGVAKLIPGAEGSTLLSAHRSRRDQLTRRLLAVGDAAAILLALAVALVIASDRSDAPELIAWGALTLPAWILLFKLYKLYDGPTARISHTAVDDLPWLAHCLLVGALGFWALTKVLPVEQVVLLEGAIFGIGALIAVVVIRSLTSRAARRLLGDESVLFAGSSARMHTLLGKINQHREYGLTPIAMLDGLNAAPRGEDAPETLGGIRSYTATVKFDALARELRPERVIIDRNEFGADQVIAMIDTCRRLSVKVSILPDAVESLGPSVQIDAVQGVTLLGVNPPMLGVTSRAIKRAFDIVISLSLLLLLAIPMLVIALAIKLGSDGPVLFSQERVGRGGRIFRLFKFRTMTADAESQTEELMALSRDPNWLDLESDPRITRVGRLLRRTSLDELPQLLNVLRGEMSLVGPRPLPEAEDRRVNGYARGRLDLTPGISGLWQVLGRTAIPFDEMLKLDYMYVTNWSLWLDMRLMLQTLPAVLGRRGVN
jgi:exopolysaccharide biosynthesis polyprenyl glycosylphosphotransferase